MSALDDPRRIDTGVFLVDAACPRCGAIEEILCSIRTVLTTPEDDLESLRLKLKAKPREHDCHQQRIPVTVIEHPAEDGR